MTGMFAFPCGDIYGGSQPTTEETSIGLRDTLVQDLCRRIRYLLTLKARPPFRLAGLEMVARLREIEHCLERLIAHHATPALLAPHRGLQPILHSIQATYSLLCEAAEWLKKTAAVLEPDGKPVRSGQQVRQELFASLQEIQATRTPDPFLGQTYNNWLSRSSVRSARVDKMDSDVPATCSAA